ncbi:MAG: hypothetical protein KatS3mg076_3014 [Candidatus Binatia bacterium]|nr:MAG: hypothetical protein KatS3mg076_3014 [Candidatus Binatia bacterium]
MAFAELEQELARLQNELARFFDSTFGASLAPSGKGVYPAVNIFDSDSAIVIKAELPGMRREDVDVVVEDDKVTIRGTRSLSYPPSCRFHRREREEGSFRRVIRLPSRLDNERATAAYRNGILTITIPKPAEAAPRKIPVQGD